MRRRHLSDAEVEALFAGRVPNGRDDLAILAGAVMALGNVADSIASVNRSDELARLVSSGLSIDKGDLPVTVGSNATGLSFGQVAGLPKWRNPVRAFSSMSRTVKAMVIAAATVFGMSVLGVAGALPGPLQSGFEGVADVVGIDASDGGDTTTTTLGDPTTNTTLGSPADNTTLDDDDAVDDDSADIDEDADDDDAVDDDSADTDEDADSDDTDEDADDADAVDDDSADTDEDADTDDADDADADEDADSDDTDDADEDADADDTGAAED